MKGSRRGVDKRPEYGVHWTSRRKERVPDEGEKRILCIALAAAMLLGSLVLGVLSFQG